MRVGIVGAGYETIALLSVLPLQGLEVVLFLDRQQRPRGVKPSEVVRDRVTRGAGYLMEQWIDFLLVPPAYEARMCQQYPQQVLPLFSHYMHDRVCSQSRVGKLGVLTTRSDMSSAEEAVQSLTAGYTLSDRQQRHKWFVAGFQVRCKDVTHWQFQLPFAGRRDRMVRNLIKTDLRYFKDAAVDTLIPFDRSILYREKQIVHRMWSKKKFHGRTAVESIVHHLLSSASRGHTSSSLQIYTTSPLGYIMASRPRKWLLSQWANREVAITLVDDF